MKMRWLNQAGWLAGSCAAMLAGLLSGCGSDSGPSTLSSLPTATGPVVSSSSARMANQLFAATTGTKISEWSDINWAAGSRSGPFCEVGNNVSGLFRDAAQPDKILCYVGAMDAAGLFANPYDGTMKYFDVSNVGEGDLKVKFRIVRGDNGITSFEMFTCQGTSPTTNDEYLLVDLTNGAAITTVMANSGGGQDFTGRTSVSGTINSDGAWLTKVITSYNYWEQDSNNKGGSYSVLTQYPNYLSLTGTYSGSNSGNSTSRAMYAVMGLLSPSTFADMALGNGIAKVNFTYGGGGGFSLNEMRAWTGDDQLRAAANSSADYYTEVNAATLPTVVSISDVQTQTAMASTETWNCQAEGSFTSVDFASGGAALEAALQACNTRYGEGGSWANCWDGNFDAP